MDKDPSSWGALVALAQSLNAQFGTSTVQGVLAAIITGALRSLYDGERRVLRVTLEGLLCGALTSPATAGTAWAIHWLAPSAEVPAEALPTMVGGAIGFIGVMQLRRIAMKKLNLEPADVA